MEGVTFRRGAPVKTQACHKLYKRRARTHGLDNNRNVVGKGIKVLENRPEYSHLKEYETPRMIYGII